MNSIKDKPIFIDTNILIYAHDINAGSKYHIAKQKIIELWYRAVLPVISVQVLQELYVNLSKKQLTPKVCQETVADYMRWTIVDNDRSLFTEGMQLKERWQLSLWDAMILAAAKRAKASTIWSEDFSVKQLYDGISIYNPFLDPH